MIQTNDGNDNNEPIERPDRSGDSRSSDNEPSGNGSGAGGGGDRYNGGGNGSGAGNEFLWDEELLDIGENSAYEHIRMRAIRALLRMAGLQGRRVATREDIVSLITNGVEFVAGVARNQSRNLPLRMKLTNLVRITHIVCDLITEENGKLTYEHQLTTSQMAIKLLSTCRDRAIDWLTCRLTPYYEPLL